MKVKTRKAAIKRFKLTATGKLKHGISQWNHLRMKKKTKVHQRKSLRRVLKSNSQTRMLKAQMSK